MLFCTLVPRLDFGVFRALVILWFVMIVSLLFVDSVFIDTWVTVSFRVRLLKKP